MAEICEIHLNRRQINAVDAPPKTIVEPGTDLVVRFVNHGSSIHLTLKAINASPVHRILSRKYLCSGY
ncbi:hypothetical protein [Methanogenium cariaci]|uniref:hypothetical protein n=1 Tax=Methanogenium cariaci TaxID=2197 RepID=UPI001C44FC60|nr:hypothetical protein [Methanogenium cariaci]